MYTENENNQACSVFVNSRNFVIVLSSDGIYFLSFVDDFLFKNYKKEKISHLKHNF